MSARLTPFASRCPLALPPCVPLPACPSPPQRPEGFDILKASWLLDSHDAMQSANGKRQPLLKEPRYVLYACRETQEAMRRTVSMQQHCSDSETSRMLPRDV